MVNVSDIALYSLIAAAVLVAFMNDILLYSLVAAAALVATMVGIHALVGFHA
jgi:hypothetical protein